MRTRLVGLAAALVTAAGLVSTGATAAQAAPCVQVDQYVVTIAGDMTDAESGGSYVGNAIPGDRLNVRIKGNPRYYGANVDSGRWGWVLASKLSYTGNSWCE